MGEKPIPRDTLDAVGRYTRFAILAELNRAFFGSGMSVDRVAARLGWSPGKVRRLLSGQTDTKVEFVGELGFAIDGSLIQFEIINSSGAEPGETDGWHPIETAPLGDQVLVWERDYGWLLALKQHHDGVWTIKSSGNFYGEMPASVVANLTHWRPLGDHPKRADADRYSAAAHAEGAVDFYGGQQWTEEQRAGFQDQLAASREINRVLSASLERLAPNEQWWAGIKVEPMDFAPSGPEAMEPAEIETHEGSWAVILDTSHKPVGWFDTHAAFSAPRYRRAPSGTR